MCGKENEKMGLKKHGITTETIKKTLAWGRSYI